MTGWLRSKLFVVPAALVLAVGLYALGGFWGLPRLIRSQGTHYVGTELKKSLTLGEIRFNPFSFELDMREIAIAEQGQRQDQPLVALQHLFVDFQISSLWKGAYTFHKVVLDRPFVRAIIRPDGSLNLAELVPESEDSNAPLPEVWIEDLTVIQGRVDFADHSRRLQPETTLSPIEFELKDFRTTAAGGGFKLSARSEQGERFDWSGRLSLQPLASTGKVGVADVKARSAYEFLGDALPFEVSGGSFDLSADYRFSAGGSAGTQLDVGLPRISVTGLGLRAQGVDRDWLTLPSVVLDNTRLSLARHEVTIDALHVDGMQATLWREADGALNIERLLTAPTAAGPMPSTPAVAIQPVASGQSAPATDWQLRLARFELQQANLEMQDRAVRPAANFKLAPLAVTASDLSLDLTKPIPITLQTVINDVAPLSISGEVVPDTAAMTMQVDLAKLPLRSLLAYLPDYPTLSLNSGHVGAKGRLSLRPAAARGPAVSFTGDAELADFDLIETAGKRELLSWDRLDIDDLAYTAGPDALSIKTLTAAKPYARVIIAPDQTINLVSVLGATTPATPQTTPRADSMPIKIGKVVLAEGAMSFADYSIQPNFQARIDALRGTISGLSSAKGSIAKIDLAGQIINRYSPVSISGETNLLAYDQHTEIKMAFKNIDLPIFNPYSGRFAGYAIAKGKLSTELHYKIDRRALVATHHVVLDQLEWGSETDSKDKVSLPVRLATSLLKDRHGVIDLNLPLAGTLDDPTFRIGPVVWQIIKNLVVKIVTSPFSFMGSLFKGAEDAQFVDFAPGSAVLSDQAKVSLPELAKGLADRPALTIDIPAGAATEVDAAVLTEQRLQAAIAALQGDEKPTSGDPTLEPDDKLDLLKDLYRQEFDKKPELPDAPEAAEDATRKERKAGRQDAAIAWLEQQLRPRYQADAAELVALGQARAAAVQEALLAGGELDPARVFLATGQSPAVKDGVLRMELGLK